MESSSILPLSQLSFFPSNPTKPEPFLHLSHGRSKGTPHPLASLVRRCLSLDLAKRLQKQRQLRIFTVSSLLLLLKLFLHNLSYLAEQSYNFEGYKELREFTDRHSLNDGDKFCADLMRESSRHKGLALRILEVRSAYCRNDFEWDKMKKLAFKMVDESNTRLMREHVVETIQNEE